MNLIYTKVMEFIIGKALANSDRIRVAVAGFVATALVQIGGACQVCSTFLTPPVVDWLSKGIAGLTITLIAAITHRDVGAPGEVVPGAAAPTLPEPPAVADGVPGDK